VAGRRAKLKAEEAPDLACTKETRRKTLKAVSSKESAKS